jgi:PIN domain nuclease of toxin-antitoxin system
MKYLFGTAAFLWSVDAAERLNTRARAILESSNEEIFLSPVVSWEIVIKVMRGKLTLTRSVDETLKLAFSKFGMQSQPSHMLIALLSVTCRLFTTIPLIVCLLPRLDAKN